MMAPFVFSFVLLFVVVVGVVGVLSCLFSKRVVFGHRGHMHMQNRVRTKRGTSS
jgi:hypothetical protein